MTAIERAEDCAKRFNYSVEALRYRRDRYLAGSFADAADRDERDMYWSAWKIALAHNRAALQTNT